MTTTLPDSFEITVTPSSTHTAELLRMLWSVLTGTVSYDLDLTSTLICVAINKQYGTNIQTTTHLIDLGYSLDDIDSGTNDNDLVLKFKR